MLALTADMAQKIGLGVLLGILVLGVLAVRITQTLVQKAISLLITAVVVFGVWTQRDHVSECADRVRVQAEAGSSPDTTCTFFGKDVTVRLP